MSNESSINNQRIVKNTLLLYFRMLLIMAVSLYTSRVILEVLGVDDYGIYNVVGGVVAMFSMLSGSLTTAISRFITHDLGYGNSDKLKRVFSTSVSIQIVISVIVLIVAEIVGIWFLNCEMNIPEGRIVAANWVLQCSILTFIINLISIPYNADIVAHENMSAFAYISIIEVSLKLVVVFFLAISPIDKLIMYAVLLSGVALLIRLVYGVYCKKKFEEATYHMILDRTIFKEMLSFAGWNFFGNTAYILNTQGVNMLINIFFGVAMNAARGIAVQVEQALFGFVNNFAMAIQPQIIKSYARGDLNDMFKLINRGTKFSAYIMFFFMIPFSVEAEIILKLWLKDVPDHSVTFVQAVLFASFCASIGSYLYYGIMATGKIRNYQILVTIVGSSVFFLSWIVYKMGFSAEMTYIIYGIVYASLNIIRLIVLKRQIQYSPMSFLVEVLMPLIAVGILSSIPVMTFVHFVNQSFLRFVGSFIISVISTSCFAYQIGLTKDERKFVNDKILVLVNKFIKR